MRNEKNLIASNSDHIFLNQLEARCIIGIFDWERKQRQRVLVDLELPSNAMRASMRDHIDDTVDYKRIAKNVLKFMQTSRFFLVESLAERIAKKIILESRIPWVRVTVSKPGAIRHSKNVGICVYRTRDDYTKRDKKQIRAFLSIGSNIRPQSMIPESIRRLDERFDLRSISHVYECSAISEKPQAAYWNLVVEIQTHLNPLSLKRQLQMIEKNMGRKKLKNKFSPRKIDLDIAFYGKKRVREKSFRIPHPDTRKCHYILLPMAEIDPGFTHPDTKKTMIEMIGSLLDEKSTFKKVVF